MNRLLSLLAVAALLGAAPASEASDPESTAAAGITGVCGNYFGGCSDWTWHKLQGPGGDYMDLHGGCRQCIIGQGWFDCHEPCNPSEEDEDVQLAYAEAMEALATDDRDTLRRLASIIPDFVTYNDEREAIQVLDCKKERVLGSFSVATQ